MLNKIFSLMIAVLLFVVLFTAIDDSFSVWGGKDEPNFISVADIAGGPKIEGGIFSDYVFPFELLSLLLVAALIGALYLAKKEA